MSPGASRVGGLALCAAGLGVAGYALIAGAPSDHFRARQAPRGQYFTVLSAGPLNSIPQES